MSIRQEANMPSETLIRTPMSFEEYMALPDGDRAEYVDGMCIRLSASPMSGHQRVSHRLTNAIEDAVPGLFVVEAVGVWTGERRSRIPDIVVVEHAYDAAWAEETPVLVVEILSPGTRREDMLRKSTEYLGAGIGQYWIVDRENRELTVLERAGSEWVIRLELDAEHARGDVAVGEHGTVVLDLETLLAP